MDRSLLHEIVNQLTYIRNDTNKGIEVDLVLEKSGLPLLVSIVAYHEQCMIWDYTDSDDSMSSCDEEAPSFTYEFCIQVCIGNEQRIFKQFDEENEVQWVVEDFIWSYVTSDGVVPNYVNSRYSCQQNYRSNAKGI